MFSLIPCKIYKLTLATFTHTDKASIKPQIASNRKFKLSFNFYFKLHSILHKNKNQKFYY